MKKIIKRKGFYTLILIITLLILLSWFRDGKKFATAEEGAPFYDINISARLYGSTWSRSGFGFVNPMVLPIGFWLNSILPVNNNFIEEMNFAFLILSGFIGMFLLVSKMISNRLIAMTASIFYFFNLYTMTQVWQRSLYAGMFSWAYLPLYTFLFIRWMEHGGIKNLITLVLSTFFYIWLFVQIGYAFSLVAISATYVLIKISREKEVIDKLNTALKSAFYAFIALMVNLWWIYPYLKLSKYFYNEVTTVNLSFESLKGVSTSFPFSQIVLLRQKFFFESSANPDLPNITYGTWYENFLPILLSLIILSVAFFGWWSWKKNKYWSFLTLTAFIGIFISKGVNPPFGYHFFQWLFNNFSFSAALRNPYEKFGLVWLLPYSVFFGIGLFEISKRVHVKLRIIVVCLLLILTCGILVWPLWTRNAFADYSWVRFPEEYRELNEYLNKDFDDVRILVLPMVPDHGARFTWGYRGSEPSEFIFDKVSISKNLLLKYYKDKYLELKNASEGIGDLEDSLKETNTKYLAIRNDLDWEPIGAKNPNAVEDILKNQPNIKFINKFGELSLYEFINTGFGFIVAEGFNKPKLIYERLSPTKYMIKVTDSKNKYSLLFKETYNDNWILEENGNIIGNHYITYGYANAWDIDKTGDYTLELVFKVWPWE